MSDQTPTPPSSPDPAAVPPPEAATDPQYAPPPEVPQYAPPPVAAPPVAAPNVYGMVPQMTGPGPVGKVRSTGLGMVLFVVTFGIYGIYWFFVAHEEMKAHTGRGIGGLVALLLALFVYPVMAFFSPHEVGGMQELGGRPRTVSALTGLWLFPFGIFLIPAIVWWVKTNGALNEYWKSMGAPA